MRNVWAVVWTSDCVDGIEGVVSFKFDLNVTGNWNAWQEILTRSPNEYQAIIIVNQILIGILSRKPDNFISTRNN